MKYTSKYFNIFSLLLKKPMKKHFGGKATRECLKKALPIYRDMILKTEDIGQKNPMAGNIYMGYVFMAICRAGNYTPDDFTEVSVEFMNSPLVQKFIAGRDMNNPDDIKKGYEKMKRYAKWADDHPEFKDKTWDFNFDETLHKDGFYYHFTRCPMEKFARENGFLDVLPVGCRLDHLMTNANHGILYRKGTLAEGAPMCDYWIVGDKVKDPK